MNNNWTYGYNKVSDKLTVIQSTIPYLPCCGCPHLYGTEWYIELTFVSPANWRHPMSTSLFQQVSLPWQQTREQVVELLQKTSFCHDWISTK